MHACRSTLEDPTHLSQISEFGLVIMLLGVSFRHVGSEIVSLVVMVLVVTSTVSTYLIQFSHRIAAILVRRAADTVFEDPMSEETRVGHRTQAPIVLVGCFRIASSLVHDLLEAGKSFKVIDFSHQVHQELNKLGVPCTYGDISHLDTLEHAGVDHAKVLVSSIPDDFLRGTSNRKLLEALRRLNSRAKILVTAESVPKALELYEAGADYVLMPRILGADRLLDIIEGAQNGGLEEVRTREIEQLKTRKEVFL